MVFFNLKFNYVFGVFFFAITTVLNKIFKRFKFLCNVSPSGDTFGTDGRAIMLAETPAA
jgi:hypothetical protein